MRGRTFFTVAVLIVLMVVAWFWLRDLDRVALVDTQGQKSSGSLAGVSMGESWQDAAYKLKRLGMVSGTYSDDGSCPLRGRFDQVIVFIDISWRKGTICIGIIKGKVASIAWRYNLFQP